MPQASAAHLVPARHWVSTPLPGPRSGPGQGRGQAAGSLFPQPERSGGGKGSAPPLPAQPALRATVEPAAQEEETWVEVPTEEKVLDRGPSAGGPRMPLSRERGPLPPLSPGAAVPDWGRTWSDLARAPAPAARSPQRYSPLQRASVHTHTLTQTHTLPAGTARDPQSRARTPSGAAHYAPAPRRVRSLAPPAARRHLPFQRAEMRGPVFGWPWEVAAVQSSSSSRSRSRDLASGPGTRARGAPREAHPGGGGVIPQPGSGERQRRAAETEPAPDRRLLPVQGGGVKFLTPPSLPPFPTPQPFSPPCCPRGAQYPQPGNLRHPLPGNSKGRTRTAGDKTCVDFSDQWQALSPLVLRSTPPTP